MRIGGPPPEIIKQVLDKDHTLKVAQRCGIPVPATYHISGISALRELRQTLRYPMIAKPLSKRKASSFKIRYFHSFAEIEKVFSVDPQFGKNTLFQEYCIGEGVGIGTLIHDGEPIAVYQHRRLKEYPSTGGVSVLAISEPPEPLLVRYSMRLLRAIDWEGPALVEFRFNRKDHTATLMEINGRYWGSIASAIHSGVDFPKYEWHIVHKKKMEVPSHYKTGLKIRWMAGDILRLHDILSQPAPHHSRWRDVIQFISYFRPSVRFMLLSYADPVPAMIEIFHVSKSLLTKTGKAFVNRIVPLKARTFIKTFKRLDSFEKLSYSCFKIERIFISPKMTISKNTKNPFKVIFLCHGNIIRSPMAEALFKQNATTMGLKNFHVSSAGINAKPFSGADPRSLVVAKELGINLGKHRAQQVTEEIIENADAIFLMDSINEARLLEKYPKAWRKLYPLSSFCKPGQIKNGEISDPYKGDIEDVRRCYHILQASVQRLVTSLVEIGQ